jgi:asparagine synthase (glutamine-hydrolysing)
VAERYGTVHEEVEVEADVAETVERLAHAFDEPLGDEAAFPTFLICEQARRHVTVALTGDGGDESFAGYERYAAFALAERVPAAPARLGARALRALPTARREPRSPLSRAARFLDAAATPPAERYARLMQVFGPALRAQLWAGQVEVSGSEPLTPRGDGITGLQLLDLETYLPGALLPKADIASMAHSLELRSPLLDRRVVELGLALPDSLKVRGREGKIALKRAFADLLPPEVATRGKSGFGVPVGRWFRSELRELSHDVLLGKDRGWFRRDVVRRLLDEHESGAADHGHRLWCLLMLELWVRTHVERPAAVAAAV